MALERMSFWDIPEAECPFGKEIMGSGCCRQIENRIGRALETVQVDEGEAFQTDFQRCGGR